MADRDPRARNSVALVGWTLAALATAVAPAPAKELKLAHFLPPVHTTHTEVAVPWAKEIGERSGGTLTVKVFPASQLGGTPPGYFKMVTTGVADVGITVANYTPALFPRTSVLELPVPPADSQHATRILYALWDKYLVEDYKDVKMLAMYAVDEFIVVTKDRPVRRVADLKGLKLRTPSQTQNRIMEALGAVPVNLPITDVYSAMDTGTVDGLTGGASVVFSFKVIDIGRYYTFGTPFSTTATIMVMNRKAWDGLSAEHKKIIDEASHLGLAMKGARAYDARAKAAVDKIQTTPGRELIRLAEAEQQAFRRAAQPVVDEWIRDMEAKGIPGKELWAARLAVR